MFKFYRTCLLACAFAALSGLSHSQSNSANPWLADSPWPMTHHDSGASDTSPFPGPSNPAQLGAAQFVFTNLINVTLAMSPKYADGQRVYWGSNLSDVYKLAIVNGQLQQVATLSKPSTGSSGLSGAYTLVDRDNIFYTVQGNQLLAYTDLGQFNSAIRLKYQTSVTSSDDVIVGLNMLWDGHLAFVTSNGVVGVINRDFSGLQTATLGDGQEQVSNSLATDYEGGIYVVTSQALYRAQWTGSNLTLDESSGAWRAKYITGSSTPSGSLGAGSGSTPTIMGSGNQRFVVITDGAQVANLVLYWADTIPTDFTSPAPNVSNRIAAMLPVNFGDPQRTVTSSQQSVVISGYGAAVVSNDYSTPPSLSDGTTAQSGTAVVLFSGLPAVQPWGVQKFVWNSVTKQLASAWATLAVSCPNGVPTVSDASNRFYCVGAYNGQWTIESLNWSSGGQHFRRFVGSSENYNSYYSGMELTGDGGIIYGSTDGAVYLPTSGQ